MKKRMKNACHGICRWMRNPGNQRVLAIVLMMIVGGTFAFADDASNVATAMDKVAGEITAYVHPVQNIVYAIAAVIAVVGAFNIYHKMTNGDQDVKKTIMLVIGGCIALVALASALPTMFGYTGG